MKWIAEFSLNAQEISKIDQAFMVIKVLVQEVYQILDVISCLYSLKFLL